jgi:anti-sigma B factor antagonist
MHFTVDVERAGTTTEIRCRGELDLVTCDRLAETIEWSYAADLRTLRLDLSGVSFVDSTALRSLIAAQARCRQNGVGFEVVPSETVAHVFDVTGLDFDVVIGGGGPTAAVDSAP